MHLSPAAMRVFFGLLTTLFALPFFLSCSEEAPPASEVYARVGSEYLKRAVVHEMIPENVDRDQRQVLVRRIVEQWIDMQVLAQLAREDGIALNDREAWQVQKLQNELLSEKYISNRVQRIFSLTEREIELYYSNNQEAFKRQLDEVHIVHLYQEQQDKAIVQEIKKSDNLMEVISKFSLDIQADRVVEMNGDLGYMPVSQLRPEFQKAIKGKKIGVIYGPIKSNDGFHYLQINDRQAAGSVRNLELVRDEIMNRLRIEKRADMIRKLKTSARSEISTETFYEIGI